MISYAGGGRLMNLVGGEMVSFYEWYGDLGGGCGEIWGEERDVGE